MRTSEPQSRYIYVASQDHLLFSDDKVPDNSTSVGWCPESRQLGGHFLCQEAAGTLCRLADSELPDTLYASGACYLLSCQLQYLKYNVINDKHIMSYP